MINLVDAGEDRDLLCKAVETVIHHQDATATHIQRRLHVGYARAAHLLELLELAGVVGPWTGPSGRMVLIPMRSKVAAVDAIRKDVEL